jgi:hypothetical protein
MISGVPLVTTLVGQAVDLAKHNVNSLVAPIDDVDSLTDLSFSVFQNKFSPSMLEKGLETAKQNSYDSQVNQWDLFFNQLMDKNVI